MTKNDFYMFSVTIIQIRSYIKFIILKMTNIKKVKIFIKIYTQFETNCV